MALQRALEDNWAHTERKDAREVALRTEDRLVRSCRNATVYKNKMCQAVREIKDLTRGCEVWEDLESPTGFQPASILS